MKVYNYRLVTLQLVKNAYDEAAKVEGIKYVKESTQEVIELIETYKHSNLL